mmetsp:Transcript_25924/g.64422  ORF Transcript_25924/g.64422 Transcript_25924/m.64422 type:complete len:112 (-) Transcript_25924:799-1134(-)
MVFTNKPDLIPFDLFALLAYGGLAGCMLLSGEGMAAPLQAVSVAGHAIFWPDRSAKCVYFWCMHQHQQQTDRERGAAWHPPIAQAIQTHPHPHTHASAPEREGERESRASA